MKPIEINENVARTCFEYKKCSHVSLADITIEVTRAGGGQTVTYPALDISNGKVCFAWDSVIYNMKHGRYNGVIKFGGKCPVVCIPLNVADCGCNLGEVSNEDFISKECLGCNQ